MTLIQQLTESLYRAPLSLRHIRKQSFKWMCIYLVTGLTIFGLFIWLLVENQEALKQLVLDHFFPSSWHQVSEQLTNFLFESQAKIVIGNMILGASLVIASMFLFPIKETYSAKFEFEAGYQNGEVREFPLWMQAWEETKLLIFYMTSQLVILWIGYYPYAWTNILAIILSYLFLFFTFGVDFISPTLQRHRTRYSLVLKVLAQKPILVLSFGALFSLPAIVISHFVFTLESLDLIKISAILFFTNLVFLTLSIPAGTRIASQLLPIVGRTLVPQKKNKIRFYSAVLITCFVMLFLHGRLISSLHYKSQILKAEYSVDWSSFDYQLPSFKAIFEGDSVAKFSVDLTIKNPTDYDIVIEQSQIFIEKDDVLISTVDLSGFEIPSGGSRNVKLSFDSVSNFSQLKEMNNLLENWRVDLQFELWPGIPFTVNIVQ